MISEEEAEDMSRRWGMNKEAYEKYRDKLSSATEETNVWGKKRPVSAVEAHENMWDKKHGAQQFRVPRVVAERLDINANAKLMYGALLCYPLGTQMYLFELAGLCGMSSYVAARATLDLKNAGLLEIRPMYRNDTRLRAPSFYKPIQPPNRFRKHETPRYLSTDLSNIEEELRERFNDLKP